MTLESLTHAAGAAARRGDVDATLVAAKRALAAMEQAPPGERFAAALELAPALLEAGFSARAASLVDAQLAASEGRCCRALLFGLRAWLRDARGDEHGALDDLERALAGGDPAAVMRRERRLLGPLLDKGVACGRLDPALGQL